jgi:sulfate transport system ATP-binding protein
MEVSDRIVVMNKGRIEQIGAPDEIYNQPASPFVYDFIGQVNLFHSRVHEGWAHIESFRLPVPEHQDVRDAAAIAYVRPHEFELRASIDEADSNGFIEAVVESIIRSGPVLRLELRNPVSDQPIHVELPRAEEAHLSLAVGSRIYARPTASRVFLANAV